MKIGPSVREWLGLGLRFWGSGFRVLGRCRVFGLWLPGDPVPQLSWLHFSSLRCLRLCGSQKASRSNVPEGSSRTMLLPRSSETGLGVVV